MTAEAIWGRVRSCFELDDGSLPVEIRGLTGVELAEIYRCIRSECRLLKPTTFWDNRTEEDRELDAVPNAAALVAAGAAAPFQFLVALVDESGADAPWIGIHVFQDSIAFDYQMGEPWNGARVLALFQWLEKMILKTAAGSLVPNSDEGPPDPPAFMSTWELFRKRDAS